MNASLPDPVANVKVDGTTSFDSSQLDSQSSGFPGYSGHSYFVGNEHIRVLCEKNYALLLYFVIFSNQVDGTTYRYISYLRSMLGTIYGREVR